MFALTWQFSVWVGLAVVAACLLRLGLAPPDGLERMGPTLFILTAMIILGELRPVVASATYESDGVPMSWAFVFAALYLWGIVPAVLLQVLAVVLGQLLLRSSPWRIFFNIGQYTLSLLAAWGVLRRRRGLHRHVHRPRHRSSTRT